MSRQRILAEGAPIEGHGQTARSLRGDGSFLQLRHPGPFLRIGNGDSFDVARGETP